MHLQWENATLTIALYKGKKGLVYSFLLMIIWVRGKKYLIPKSKRCHDSDLSGCESEDQGVVIKDQYWSIDQRAGV